MSYPSKARSLPSRDQCNAPPLLHLSLLGPLLQLGTSFTYVVQPSLVFLICLPPVPFYSIESKTLSIVRPTSPPPNPAFDNPPFDSFFTKRRIKSRFTANISCRPASRCVRSQAANHRKRTFNQQILPFIDISLLLLFFSSKPRFART